MKKMYIGEKIIERLNIEKWKNGKLKIDIYRVKKIYVLRKLI